MLAPTCQAPWCQFESLPADPPLRHHIPQELTETGNRKPGSKAPKSPPPPRMDTPMLLSVRVASFSAIAAALFSLAAPEISHLQHDAAIAAATPLRQAATHAACASATVAPLDGIGWD